jgi:hypothetical protein
MVLILTNYIIQSKRFSAKNRPTAVGDWLQRTRSLTWFPDLSKPSLMKTYSNNWWVWWMVCQPSWRIPNSDGKGFRHSSGSGDWSTLLVGGKNGMLLHVMALAWWGNAALGTAQEMKKWTVAVKEVAWAFKKMHASLK